MATRRIARGRGGSPVPIIILVVLLVGAVGLSVVLGMKLGDLEDLVVQVRKQMSDLEQRRNEEQTRMRQYETLVGLPYEVAGTFDPARAFETWKKEFADTYKLEPGSGGPRKLDTARDLVAAYAESCRDIKSQRDDLQGQLTEAKAQRAQAVEDARAAKAAQTKAVDEQTAIAEQLRKDKENLRAERDKAALEASKKIDDLTKEKTQLIKDLNAAQKLADVREEKIKDLQLQIEDLRRAKETLGPLVTPRAGEPVDGRIITVAADGKTVMIDTGRQDWAAIGMEFEIYDNADPEARKAKGHIQVREVFDTISRCKILQQDELDPILPGMVIVSPAFSRGRVLNIVLVGRFSDANVEQYLSRYPCKVVWTESGEEKAVTRDTDYVVLGGAPVPPGKPRPEDTDAVAKARELGITLMKEDDLLRYLGQLD